MSVDLDADGKDEKITWVEFAETENEGRFYQVRVLKEDGSLLWEGPKVADTTNPFVFGDWHFGYSLPELAADIDGDGAVEMVTPAPQSDVSPTFFRVLRWRGGRFVLARSGTLLEAPKGTGRFPWSEAEEWQGTWISSFLAANGDGTLRVELFEYRGGVEALTGEAVVAPVEGGYAVRSWTRPMKRPEEGGASAGSDGAEGGRIVYRARLGKGDHFNSVGDRLDKVEDILRQDRANFHGGRGDVEDGGEDVFATRKGRDEMDRKRVLAASGSPEALVDAILNGTPLVEVEVGQTSLKVRLINR